MSKIFALLFISTMSITLGACNSKKDNKEVKLENYSIHRDDEFGGAYIDTSIDGFNKLGFKFGDSLDLSFSVVSLIKLFNIKTPSSFNLS